MKDSDSTVDVYTYFERTKRLLAEGWTLQESTDRWNRYSEREIELWNFSLEAQACYLVRMEFYDEAILLYQKMIGTRNREKAKKYLLKMANIYERIREPKKEFDCRACIYMLEPSHTKNNQKLVELLSAAEDSKKRMAA